MKEAIFRNVNVSHQKFSDNRKSVFFCEFFSLFEEVLKISFIAKFGDDVAIVSCTEDVVAFEYVGVV